MAMAIMAEALAHSMVVHSGMIIKNFLHLKIFYNIFFMPPYEFFKKILLFI